MNVNVETTDGWTTVTCSLGELIDLSQYRGEPDDRKTAHSVATARRVFERMEARA